MVITPFNYVWNVIIVFNIVPMIFPIATMNKPNIYFIFRIPNIYR